MSKSKGMFGEYKLDENCGVNPPWSPAHPIEWGCELHTLVVMTKVDKNKLKKLFATGNPATPFEIVNDRVAFQFMASPGHTMSYHCIQTFDLMVTIGVKYEGLYAHNHIYMFTADPMGIVNGREVCGYTKKDCTYGFDEQADGSISGWVNRRGFPIADFEFTPDPTAPVILLGDGSEQPAGELHVRRLPHPSKDETVYADVVYRRAPLEYAAPIPGRIKMNLHSSKYDALTDLEPEVLSAHYLVSDIYGGGWAVEDRRILKRLIP